MKTVFLKHFAALTILAVAAAATEGGNPAPAAPAPAPFPVSITVDAAKPIGAWKPVYRFFGADEPNYATMKDGKKLIGELGALRAEQKDVYYRAHNLLTTGDGTAHYKWGSTNAYTEDAGGKPVYDWKILDGIFDTYHNAGIKPYVQIGFMPQALSLRPEPYEHHWDPSQPYNAIYTGWNSPPKDYDKWAELVYQWAKHCVERYGLTEVETWYWEVWNESNTGGGKGYWGGTAEEYRKLYDYSATAVRRAIPKARVGGADAAGDGSQWSRDFIQHCLTGTNYATGQVGAPLDFFSFHAKGTTPIIVGATGTTPAHTQMGLGGQLQVINRGFTIAASYPQTKPLPIVIGESDPDGCAACNTEALRDYRRDTVYPTYTAACIAREFELADRHGVNLEGALTWAFEFEDEPYFKGQRVLATNGIDLPILDVFRMYSKMSGQRVAATSDHAMTLDSILRSGVHGDPDVGALSTLDKNKLCVMAWHYHDDLVPGPDATVSLNLTGLPKDVTKVKITHYRIDETHSNSYTAWKKMGSPEKPTPEQYAQLEKAGQLEQLPLLAATPLATNGELKLPSFALPRQSVSLIVAEWD